MSAIWGVVNLSAKQIPSDYEKVFENEYRRKAKIDDYDFIHTSSAIIGRGLQIITDEDRYDNGCIFDFEKGIVFVADCVLDNRKDLSSSSTLSDSQIIYSYYLKYGLDFTKHLLGTYSIAIWDQNKYELTLISDHVSSRCLYYTCIDDVVIFSTILSPLIYISKKNSVNKNYIKDFLLADFSRIYTVPGETHIKDVFVMRPARTLTFTSNGICENVYWTPKVSSSGNLDDFMRIYNNCVSDAIRTCGNVGITLSGGLDSSSIAALASRNIANKVLYSYTQVPTIKFDEQISLSSNPSSHSNIIYDESKLVYDIVNMYDNIKPQFLDNNGKNDFEDISNILDIFEMPYKIAPFASHLEICQKASSDKCKVILVGEYGNTSISFGELDNILYNFYLNKDSTNLVKYASTFCKHENIDTQKYILNKLSSFRSFDSFIENGGCLWDNYIPSNHFVSPAIINGYDFINRMSQDRRATLSRGFITENQYKEFLTGESLQIYLGILKTKFGLYSGTLLRDPTMDKRIIEFCYNLPIEFFAKDGINRFLIRQGFKELLPSSIIDHWRLKGVQSADWAHKIVRDWNKLSSCLLKVIDNAPSNYILLDQIRKFILEFDNKNFDYNNKDIINKLYSLFIVINITILLENFTN